MALVKLTTTERVRIWVESGEVYGAELTSNNQVELWMCSGNVYHVNADSYRARRMMATDPPLPAVNAPNAS